MLMDLKDDMIIPRLRFAELLGVLVFDGSATSPGEMLTRIAAMQEALACLEARYARMTAQRAPEREQAQVGGQMAPAPAPRTRRLSGARGRPRRVPGAAAGGQAAENAPAEPDHPALFAGDGTETPEGR